MCVVFLIPISKRASVLYNTRSRQLSKHTSAQHLRLLFNLIVCDMCLLSCLILEACWAFATVCEEFSLEISVKCLEKYSLPINLLYGDLV